MKRKPEPRPVVALRQRRFRARKLAARRREHEDIFRVFLEQLYAERNIKPVDWLAAKDFFAACDVEPVRLTHLKTIETATIHIGGDSYAIIRPRYLLDAK